MPASRRPFEDPAVENAFESFPEDVRSGIMQLRDLILDTGAKTEGVGAVVETLKWGQPAYLPARPRTGSTVRIGMAGKQTGRYAMFFHCQTNLVRTFREIYPDAFAFEGNRALVFEGDRPLPREALSHCIAMALTYHLNKKKQRYKKA